MVVGNCSVGSLDRLGRGIAVAGVLVDWLSRRGVTERNVTERNSSRTDTLFTPHAADEEFAG